jgi:hypothetical protein
MSLAKLDEFPCFFQVVSRLYLQPYLKYTNVLSPKLFLTAL